MNFKRFVDDIVECYFCLERMPIDQLPEHVDEKLKNGFYGSLDSAFISKYKYFLKVFNDNEMVINNIQKSKFEELSINIQKLIIEKWNEAKEYYLNCVKENNDESLVNCDLPLLQQLEKIDLKNTKIISDLEGVKTVTDIENGKSIDTVKDCKLKDKIDDVNNSEILNKSTNNESIHDSLNNQINEDYYEDRENILATYEMLILQLDKDETFNEDTLSETLSVAGNDSDFGEELTAFNDLFSITDDDEFFNSL
uniref:Uncharacterized protein n=1 Tax=Parastrongyloides trichosuri TaxID=131310 RepID=A0A0N4Z7W7_PARTI